MKQEKKCEELLPDVYLIKLPFCKDERGTFTKTYHPNLFADYCDEPSIAETFYTVSSKNVIRGMHFQGGNAAHTKIVYCSCGSALDVIVDVRRDSRWFNKPVSIELHGEDEKAIVIGKGYAHGFLSLENRTIMNYITTTVHDPHQDYGVHWSSIAFDWPACKPIVSQRDCSHGPITEVKCEFS
jgi:dTDP-4-dehydrorhamnose 3,5-epimerase